ncbi:unnamed protein product [Spirodela intermedia]|uniref:Uncharacterized protein n=2 Tax=Spirodela intermedia TaxID=51605 RepID=A0A7I8JDP4_SPIIN|nr:unnamed protein product [Spirodela intermedia]CAA6668276.1 unnamed protein product [Spirodela intermedia]CAA7405116.1 unnamed protein product [Spirodela intermedia]
MSLFGVIKTTHSNLA